ncbi:MAG: hypothetical protein KAX20_01200 [Candidatus Omnitrophica bacterium]|nr:hypothetical protein [Candidatus Omnitrophota bacterium]
MEFELGYLLALSVVGLGILGIILALLINEINKTKFIISFILSIIILGLGGYYYYLIGLYQSKKGLAAGPLNRILRIYRPISVTLIPEEEETVPSELESKVRTHFMSQEEIGVIVEVEDKKNFLREKDHLKIKKGKKLKIIDTIVPGVKKNLIRVNFVGFVGDPIGIKGEDRGYEIDTSSLMKKYALNKEGSCYKIEVIKGKEIIGTVFIDLVK